MKQWRVGQGPRTIPTRAIGEIDGWMHSSDAQLPPTLWIDGFEIDAQQPPPLHSPTLSKRLFSFAPASRMHTDFIHTFL